VHGSPSSQFFGVWAQNLIPLRITHESVVQGFPSSHWASVVQAVQEGESEKIHPWVLSQYSFVQGSPSSQLTSINVAPHSPVCSLQL
jgi:hypothetical protein